jgi:predicted MFS family arabinose efflux permease
MLSLVRLIVAWATLFTVGTDLFVVSPLIPIISDNFQVSTQSAGLMVTAFALGYILAAPVFGHLADRVGRRLILTWCLAGFAAANLLTAAALTLPAMMAARVLCGITAAGITPSIYALVGQAAPSGYRGTWIAIVLTGLLSSLPLGASVGVTVGLWLGWPVVFCALAGCSLLFTPIHYAIWANDGRGATSTGSGPAGFSAKALACSLAPTMAWSSALYGMYTYLGAGLTGMGYQPAAISEIIFIYGAAAFAGALLGGRMADRLGPLTTVRISLAGMSLCFMMLWLAIDSGICAEAAFAMTSLTAQIFFPAQQSLLISRFPERYGTALSFNNSALFTGIALGSILGGQTMAIGGFTAIMPFSAAVALAGFTGLGWQRTQANSLRGT